MDIALLYAMLRHRTFTYLAFPRQTPSDSYTFLSTSVVLKPLTVLATVQLVLSFDTRIWKSFGYAFSNIIFTFSISYNFSKSTIRKALSPSSLLAHLVSSSSSTALEPSKPLWEPDTSTFFPYAKSPSSGTLSNVK